MVSSFSPRPLLLFLKAGVYVEAPPCPTNPSVSAPDPAKNSIPLQVGPPSGKVTASGYSTLPCCMTDHPLPFSVTPCRSFFIFLQGPPASSLKDFSYLLSKYIRMFPALSDRNLLTFPASVDVRIAPPRRILTSLFISFSSSSPFGEINAISKGFAFPLSAPFVLLLHLSLAIFHFSPFTADRDPPALLFPNSRGVTTSSRSTGCFRLTFFQSGARSFPPSFWTGGSPLAAGLFSPIRSSFSTRQGPFPPIVFFSIS